MASATGRFGGRGATAAYGAYSVEKLEWRVFAGEE
jgi:hypothetical protein